MTAGWHTGIDGLTVWRGTRLAGLLVTPEMAELVVATLNLADSSTRILQAINRLETKTMTALEDLQAGTANLDASVTALVAEQATFLTDVAAKLAAAGVDPAALAEVTNDLNAQAAKLNDLAAAQAAADPGAPPAV